MDELHIYLEELKSRFEQLSSGFVIEGKRLKSPGCPPDPAFLARASEATREFQLIADKLGQMAEEWSWSGFEGEMDSIVQLEKLWHGLADYLASELERRIRVARALVKKAKEAALPGEEGSEEFKGLREKLYHYEELLSRHADEEETVELCHHLSEGTHPLNAFLKLSGENLGCRESTALFSVVAAEFGMLIAVAATRKNLVFSERSEIASLSIPVIEPSVIRQQDLRERVPGLICSLVKDEKFGPAYWLTCYHEQKFGNAPVPSWLIKAAELAGIVEGNDGPAAKWLAHIYTHSDFEVLLEEPAGTKGLALNLLAVSILLRPALVAPRSGAPVLLEKLGDLPKGLKAVCVAVVGGERSSSGQKKEQDILSEEVRRWQKHNQKLTMVAPLAAKSWETMQEEGGLLRRLLRPLQEKDNKAMDDIRELVDRLRGEDGLKREVGRLYRRMQEKEAQPNIFHVLGSWQVLARLREALILAERWLKLQEKAMEAEEVVIVPRYDKLLVLLQSARGELGRLAQRHQGDILAGLGVDLCGHALSSLEEFLQRGWTKVLTAEELAFVELNKNPQLKLGPLWRPEEEVVERMGEALVELIDDSKVGERGEKAGGDGFADILSAEPFKLEEMLEKAILTSQEREFINDNFFDRLGKVTLGAGA